MAARRRRYNQVPPGQLSFDDLLALGEKEKGGNQDEPVRRDGPGALGPVAAGPVRGDQRSGQLLLGPWGGSEPADHGPDRGPGGQRSGRRGLPGEGGPAQHGETPGGGDSPARADLAGARTGSERRAGGSGHHGQPAGAAAHSGPQPPEVGGSERRAAGTGPGLAASRFRPRSQDDLAPSGAVSRIRANLAALAALRDLERDQRPATPAEQAVLARWSGWGAVPEVFDASRAELGWARDELSAILTAAELAAAARNTLNAHYTDAALVQAIWAGAGQLGF